MVTTEISSETKFNSKLMPVFSQALSKVMTEPSDIFQRILITLDSKNAPEVARKLGLAKQSVYDWQKSTPSLDNLLKIAESGNTSLDWLVTGKGNRFLNEEQQTSIDKLLDDKMREIAREEIQADAQKSVASDDITHRAYFKLFGKSIKEKLNAIADRLELVYKDAGRELPQHIINEIAKFREGKFSEVFAFKEVFSLSQYSTKTSQYWLLTGEGDRHDFEAKNSYSSFDFYRDLIQAKQHEENLIEQERDAQKEQQITQNVLNNLLTYLVQTGVVKLEDLGNFGGLPSEYKAPSTNKDKDKKVA